MDISKLSKFSFLKKEVEEFRWQKQTFELWKQETRRESRNSKDPNDVCGCIIAWYSFSISKDKVDQVISVVLNMLAMKDSFSLVLVFCLFSLNMKVDDIIMCLNWIYQTQIL